MIYTRDCPGNEAVPFGCPVTGSFDPAEEAGAIAEPGVKSSAKVNAAALHPVSINVTPSEGITHYQYDE